MADFTALCKMLQTAANYGFKTLADACVIVDELLPSLQTPEFVMHGPLAIDFSSCDLIPTEHYAEFVALKIFGDGKCCFRAASLMLFGTEQNHLEIRVCTILELAKYSFFYLAEGKVITTMHMEAEMAILNAKLSQWWSITMVVLCFAASAIGNQPGFDKIAAARNKRSDPTALYRVSVETADGLLTGTDANVFIQIFGKLGNTSVVQLTKSGNLFESGQVDKFILVEKAVGSLTRVGIKRDKEGPFDDWKLDRVTVQPAASHVYKFAFNEWIKPNVWVYSYGG